MAAKPTAFESAISELLGAIDESFERRRILPTLILVYSAIDIMAWLDRPVSNTSAKGKTLGIGDQYKKWVSEFMKPTAVLKASPDEIWAWRCGVVHSFSFESDATRQAKARKALYCYGAAQLAVLRRIGDVRAGKAAAIKIEHLVGQTKCAIQRFRAELKNDASRAERVYKRAADGFYFTVKV